MVSFRYRFKKNSPKSNPYRDFRADIHNLDGVPLSDVEGDLATVANVLKKEGYLSIQIVDGKISYQKTPKADQVIEAMI